MQIIDILKSEKRKLEDSFNSGVDYFDDPAKHEPQYLINSSLYYTGVKVTWYVDNYLLTYTTDNNVLSIQAPATHTRTETGIKTNDYINRCTVINGMVGQKIINTYRSKYNVMLLSYVPIINKEIENLKN